MPSPRWVPGALATSVACALALSLVPSASAAPTDPDGDVLTRVAEERSQGRAFGTASLSRVVQRGEADLPAQPRNDVIEDVPVNPADASIPLNLIPYHEFAPRLRALQASDRISVEVIGQSTQGRDMHLVVATSPMSDGEWDDWQELSDLRTEDPAAALALFEAGGYDGWKKPVFINNNIHGNEWEGTDAAFRLLDELATSTDPEVEQLLEDHVVAVVMSNNPDGRVNATRANGNGFDMNRDHITQSQPEVRTVRDQIIRYNPLTFIDLHGYVGGTLIEPTTGPHGENYEYDLYIRNAIRNALAMEAEILAEVGPDLPNWQGSVEATQLDIPWRNRTTGWDDWPPIFTPMYAMYHGAIGHTIEFPLNPRSSQLSVEERHRRTAVNTRVALSAMEGNLGWVAENGDTLLADQLELFRRGAAGEGTRPVDDELALSLAAGTNDETFTKEFPRAYVVPAGDAQRSDTAAARLVQFLVDNDVAVTVAKTPVRIGGERFEAGSYVVDMHQAKRGLASTILEPGRDVSDEFPTMYDISGWSLGDLWGASVEVVEETGRMPVNQLVDVSSTVPTGSFPEGRRAGYRFEVDSLEGVQAVNRLATAGLALGRLEDGGFVVSGDAAEVRAVARELGVAFSVAGPADVAAAAPFSGTRLGVSGLNDELFALRAMGFDVTPVSHTGFNDGSYAFDDFDALYVSSTAFNPQSLDATAQAAFSAWLAEGHNVVGRGAGGALFSTRADLLAATVASTTNSATPAAGQVRSDANGTVRVVNDPASPVTGDAGEVSFVSPPRPFTSVPAGARVDQRLGDGSFVIAGHWIGSAAWAGAPVVVSGSARGADVTLFGTEPLYRAHPQGLFTQVAEGLWW
ncbi:M14 family zinc carboxypeptidase [Aquipuribacter sp. SD81]|uniref:M14 family zinc carboxypeptidase n=1 Tax=Aquipuribacter sp. SD81 TaxID=3127703 RepID=UPI003018F8E2